MVAVLLIIVVITVVGGIFVYVRHRPPDSLEDGIQSFRREMEALAPRDVPTPQRRWWRR